MTLRWITYLRRALTAVPPPRKDRGRLDTAKFGIGFCPGCKRLRGTTSLRCGYCGSAAAVTADA
jgi:hypothetical protein